MEVQTLSQYCFSRSSFVIRERTSALVQHSCGTFISRDFSQRDLSLGHGANLSPNVLSLLIVETDASVSETMGTQTEHENDCELEKAVAKPGFAQRQKDRRCRKAPKEGNEHSVGEIFAEATPKH